jgi:methylmalonyl-CoA/ethylmalonyl-CoA epimerase
VTLLRRLDHVAIVVRDTQSALEFYSDRLGLSVASSEEIASPHVKLTYLDAGNAYVQLVEPLDDTSPLAGWLDEHGEGLHHICFGVDDVAEAVAALSDPGAAEVVLGSGRGRPSGFLSSAAAHGVVVELTGFDLAEDVDGVRGYLAAR